MEAFSQIDNFSDFDDFAVTTRAWDLSFNQLDSGGFEGSLMQFGSDDFLIGHAHFSRSLLQRGCAPAGLRTVVIPTERCTPLNWRRHKITPHDLIVYARNGDWESVSRPGFDIYSLSLSEEFLDQVCRDMELPAFQTLAQRAEVFPCMPDDFRALLHDMSRSLSTLCGPTQSPVQAEALATMKRDLARQVLLLMSRPLDRKPLPSARLRERALKKAMAYIAEHGHLPLTMETLCQVTRASERTLEYGFREHYGVTPKSYLLKHRLNGVRKHLRRLRPDQTTIVEQANQWSFWHMGQFAADYRKLFGELPLETLRRCDGVR